METIENPTVTFVRLALDVICEAERRLRIKGEKWFLGSSRWFFTSACCFGGRCNLRTPALIDWNIEALKVTPSSSFLIKFQLLFFPRMKMCDLRRVERILWRPLAWLSQTSLTSLSLALALGPNQTSWRCAAGEEIAPALIEWMNVNMLWSWCYGANPAGAAHSPEVLCREGSVLMSCGDADEKQREMESQETDRDH